MDVPKDFNNVGWYKYGIKPGEQGNAVLAGHLDTPTGSEAVFFKLNTLVPGDTITVVDEDSKKHTFIVTDKKAFDTKTFPLEQVFGPSSTKGMNLITCNGTFLASEKMYNQRLVIFTKLQES